jgi:ParB-like chromosome segregation protein Spo0J
LSTNLEIKWRKISELIPYARNARIHSPEQVQQIAASIREFGFNNPILLDGDNGIIAGHGRIMGAEVLGMDPVPTIELSHLSEEQKRAYVLADNKIALNGSWDEHLLTVELGELASVGDLDIELTGFDLEEIGELIDIDGFGFPELADEDREPFRQRTFILHDEQDAKVRSALKTAISLGAANSEINENKNGNALARICEDWCAANA